MSRLRNLDCPHIYRTDVTTFYTEIDTPFDPQGRDVGDFIKKVRVRRVGVFEGQQKVRFPRVEVFEGRQRTRCRIICPRPHTELTPRTGSVCFGLLAAN